MGKLANGGSHCVSFMHGATVHSISIFSGYHGIQKTSSSVSFRYQSPFNYKQIISTEKVTTHWLAMSEVAKTDIERPAKRQKRRMTQEEYDAWVATLDSQPSRGEADWVHDPESIWQFIHVQLPAMYPDPPEYLVLNQANDVNEANEVIQLNEVNENIVQFLMMTNVKLSELSEW